MDKILTCVHPSFKECVLRTIMSCVGPGGWSVLCQDKVTWSRTVRRTEQPKHSLGTLSQLHKISKDGYQVCKIAMEYGRGSLQVSLDITFSPSSNASDPSGYRRSCAPEGKSADPENRSAELNDRSETDRRKWFKRPCALRFLSNARLPNMQMRVISPGWFTDQRQPAKDCRSATIPQQTASGARPFGWPTKNSEDSDEIFSGLLLLLAQSARAFGAAWAVWAKTPCRSKVAVVGFMAFDILCDPTWRTFAFSNAAAPGDRGLFAVRCDLLAGGWFSLELVMEIDENRSGRFQVNGQEGAERPLSSLITTESWRPSLPKVRAKVKRLRIGLDTGQWSWEDFFDKVPTRLEQKPKPHQVPKPSQDRPHFKAQRQSAKIEGLELTQSIMDSGSTNAQFHIAKPDAKIPQDSWGLLGGLPTGWPRLGG
ncbi:hypothetical protein V8F33_010497 [Rhypophila sp. PSN 637]